MLPDVNRGGIAAGEGGSVELDHNALRTACFEAARKTMADSRPTDLEKIQRLADIFLRLAMQHMARITEQGRDPRILVRAVSYLARTHAIPQMHDGTEWFFFMLRALVELSCPEKELDGEATAFLEDLAEGIRRAVEKSGKYGPSR